MTLHKTVTREVANYKNNVNRLKLINALKIRVNIHTHINNA